MTQSPRTREAGQTMAEYAVVLGVISVVLVLSLTVFAGAVAKGIQHATSLIPG